MKLSAFLKGRSLLLLLHLTCMSLLAGFLHITGYAGANITLICIVWLMILSLFLFSFYLQRRHYFRKAADILDHMDKPYLLGEVLPASCLLEDKLYRDMLRRSNKAVIEKIHALEDAQQDYRDYLESWVHEIKTPITAITLLSENIRKTAADDSSGSSKRLLSDSGDSITPAISEVFRKISLENGRIENYVDLILYHARSEQVYKDYLIRKTNLKEVVYEVLEKEHLLLIRHQVQAEVLCGDQVFTDKKWISFILNQLILNSVKYRGDAPVLRFETHRGKNNITLILEDNGTGIPAEDLPRIFEKGFTGSNGRDHEKATGMGLYLCKKLCGRLGISLSAQSEYGKGTKMLLTFPLSSHNGPPPG